MSRGVRLQASGFRDGVLVLVVWMAGACASAVRPGPDIVMQAFEAKLRGFGGCAGEIAVTETPVPLFPDVTFFLGKCELEHGDPGASVVAVDEQGLLYLLDSESSLKLLIRRHTPAIDARERPFEYAGWMLHLLGIVPWEARLIGPEEALPAHLADERVAGPSFGEYPGIFVSMYTDDSFHHIALILTSDGALNVVDETHHPIDPR